MIFYVRRATCAVLTALCASSLLVFLAEYGEVYVAFGVRLEVEEQVVGTGYSVVEVVVERGVGHETAEEALAAVELGGHALHVGYGLVYVLHGGLQVEAGKI